jgi:DNA-binding XRE family transcriptional regulator
MTSDDQPESVSLDEKPVAKRFGARPNEERRREMIRLRQTGLSLRKIGKLIGVSRQCVSQTLQCVARGRSVPCVACAGPIISPAARVTDAHAALCLPCLRSRPDPPAAELVRALRLAVGLTKQQLSVRAGVSVGTIRRLESGDAKRERRQSVLSRLVTFMEDELLARKSTTAKRTKSKLK